MPGHPFGTHEAWRTLDCDRRQGFCGPGDTFFSQRDQFR
jgi:hypothetical protein